MSEDRVISDVVVLGGGTAGWLTALYAKNNLPNKNITVIESDSIGILGAGEGSTPHLIDFLDGLNIPISSLIIDAKSTVKNGIKFTNWQGKGPKDSYYHPFSGQNDFSIANNCASPYISLNPSLFLAAASEDKSIFAYDFVSNLSEKNKVPFIYNKNIVDPSQDRILDYDRLGEFSIHFDARELANLLKKIAIERGVFRVEGVIESSVQDSFGDVKKLILESGEEISCDFVFDCSGFSRFFAKKLGLEWVSYSKYLPVNSALPFFTEIDVENIPPYTEAIAMDYGWMWKIPLQHRYGCGYVFDSSLISEESAKEEVQKFLGHAVDFSRLIKFEPGRLSTPWINNVFSLGLSASFIEPLEATSIWVSLYYMREILGSPEVMHLRDKRIAENSNKFLAEVNDNILNFVYFHYMGGREDTEFWKKFSYENAPDGLKKYLEILDFRLLQPRDMGITGEMTWDVFSWYQVAFGIGYPKLNDYIYDSYFYNNFRNTFKSNYLTYKSMQEQVILSECSSHADFLENMKRK